MPKKYNNSNELKKELKNKSFIIIKQGLMSNLCNTNKLIGKDLEFKFENDSIFIIFTDNDKLNTFINNGVIGKNKMEQISSSFSSIKAEIPIDNIKCKKDLEILIRIFYYNKYLREKENTSFKDIIIEKTDENNIAIKTNEIVYLINNLWMKEYKSYYEYQDLTNYLRNKNEYLTDLSNEIINKIIDSLPIEYISKINKKIIFNKNKIFIYQKNKFDEKIFYLYNNHKKKKKIYDLFKESGYKIVDSLIKFELYFVGNNKILLYFSNKKEIGKYVDEIGFINEKGTFIPEYLLDFSANNITSKILNDFFHDFSNLFLDNNYNIEIKNKNKEKIGNCFKLNNITNSILINKVNSEVYEKSDNIIFEEIKSGTTTNLNENNENSLQNANYQNYLNNFANDNNNKIPNHWDIQNNNCINNNITSIQESTNEPRKNQNIQTDGIDLNEEDTLKKYGQLANNKDGIKHVINGENVNNNTDSNKSEEKIISKNPNSQKPKIIVNNMISNPNIRTNFVMEQMKKEKIKFDETRKNHVEFLLRLFIFEDKLNVKIKKSLEFKTLNISIENGYIINHQIIDKYKEFYKLYDLKSIISKDNNLKNVYLKYKNNNDYISENVINNFVNESLDNLLKESIKEINSMNILGFKILLEKEKLYKPTLKFFFD